jgi:hypothetical protein
VGPITQEKFKSYLTGWKSKVLPQLVVPCNGLVQDIVLWARTSSRMKTYDLWSGDNGACALFSSWRCPLENLY